jgi:hypothetical protein
MFGRLKCIERIYEYIILWIYLNKRKGMQAGAHI